MSSLRRHVIASTLTVSLLVPTKNRASASASRPGYLFADDLVGAYIRLEVEEDGTVSQVLLFNDQTTT